MCVSVTYGESDSEPNQGIIDGVENTTIDADISMGSGYIRLDWTKSAGYKMDKLMKSSAPLIRMTSTARRISPQRAAV